MAAAAQPQVLIVGAGPTGLVLALWLSHLGVRVRIVDKLVESGTTSRALGVQARTLEFYRQLGIADSVVEAGLPLASANLWVKGNPAAHVNFGTQGRAISPFPFLLIYPQDEHETYLTEKLRSIGVEIDRGVELVEFSESADSKISATLRRKDGTEEICKTDFIAGCDGAHSKVRHSLNIQFDGAMYDQMFYVADVHAKGPVMNRQLHLALDTDDFLAAFPLKAEGQARLIGTVRQSETKAARLTWESVNTSILNRLRIEVEKVNWFSTHRVHHRVAQKFRVSSAFLLGDAAHIHSPVGGQGMNTGIGDAINLAWKMADVIHGRSGRWLLDTYEIERKAFAELLVSTTDRIFTLVTSRGSLATPIRTRVVPFIMPLLFRSDLVRRTLFRLISQTRINYRMSERLSRGRAGHLKGGDRLPWVRFADDACKDNWEPLSSLAWQAHFYGKSKPSALVDACRKLGLELHFFQTQSMLDKNVIRENSVLLIRPDGYIAWAALLTPEGAADLAHDLRAFVDSLKET